MATIFLSYKSNDQELAVAIEKALRDRGHEVRYDAELQVGDEWRRDLLEALQTSDALLVLLNKVSLTSPFVISEIGAARAFGLERGMFMLPIIEGDIPIPPFVQDIFAAHLKRRTPKEINRIADAVDRGIKKHFNRLRGRYPGLFISHRHKDADIAKALVELLAEVFDIGPGAIRCTSVHPYKLPAGERHPERLRAEIRRARAVLGILTPATKDSIYTLFELGAAWSHGVLTLPLLTRGATQADVPPPLGDRHPMVLTDPQDCLQLIEDLADVTGFKRRRGTRQNIPAKVARLVELASAVAPPPSQIA